MRIRHLIPAAVVILLAVVPWDGSRLTGRACTTDGPQYACWLNARGK